MLNGQGKVGMADLINGLFELGGGILLLINCYTLHRDKTVQGISPIPVYFFTAWGYWNLWFYPALSAWYSFAGGILVVAVNTVWLAQLFYYKRLQCHTH